jgi:MFS superfamily sulfate permease-like transporter
VLARKRGTNVFRPLSPEHAGDEVFAGLLILRPEGRVFFANARRLGQRMRQHVTEDMPRVVLLDLSGVIDLEYTALKMLIEAERALGEQGVSLWLAGLNPEVLAMVRRATLADALGAHRMFATLEQALVRFQSPAASSS